jgi:hypothetical protein
MPVANAVPTTVVDTWGRSWTPRCPSRSSDLLRWPVMGSRGPGHSPEKRTAAGAGIDVVRTSDAHQLARAWALCRIKPYWIKTAPLRGTAGAPVTGLCVGRPPGTGAPEPDSSADQHISLVTQTGCVLIAAHPRSVLVLRRPLGPRLQPGRCMSPIRLPLDFYTPPVRRQGRL